MFVQYGAFVLIWLQNEVLRRSSVREAVFGSRLINGVILARLGLKKILERKIQRGVASEYGYSNVSFLV